jgi:hypothetical protein
MDSSVTVLLLLWLLASILYLQLAFKKSMECLNTILYDTAMVCRTLRLVIDVVQVVMVADFGFRCVGAGVFVFLEEEGRFAPRAKPKTRIETNTHTQIYRYPVTGPVSSVPNYSTFCMANFKKPVFRQGSFMYFISSILSQQKVFKLRMVMCSNHIGCYCRFLLVHS